MLVGVTKRLLGLITMLRKSFWTCKSFKLHNKFYQYILNDNT